LHDADALVEEMRQTEHPEFEMFSYVPSQTYRTIFTLNRDITDP